MPVVPGIKIDYIRWLLEGDSLDLLFHKTDESAGTTEITPLVIRPERNESSSATLEEKEGSITFRGSIYTVDITPDGADKCKINPIAEKTVVTYSPGSKESTVTYLESNTDIPTPQ